MTEAETRLINEALDLYVTARTAEVGGDPLLAHVTSFQEAARDVRRERFGREWPGWERELKQLHRNCEVSKQAYRKMLGAIRQCGMVTEDEMDALIASWREELRKEFPSPG